MAQIVTRTTYKLSIIESTTGHVCAMEFMSKLELKSALANITSNNTTMEYHLYEIVYKLNTTTHHITMTATEITQL